MPHTARLTPIEAYTEAVEQLLGAVDALDQAHSTMRDAGVDDVASRRSGGLSIRGLVLHAEGILTELQRAACDDCGHPLSKHGDPGCCACTWGVGQ